MTEEEKELLELIKGLPDDERTMLIKLLKRAVERGTSGSTPAKANSSF
jgi:aconitase B